MEEMLFEQMMEQFSGIMTFYPILSLVSLATTALCILYMHFDAQHRNQKLGMGWYVCGVLFGIWTVLIYLLKRKNFPGPDLKVCPACGNRCPVSFEVCNRCLVELPEVNTEEKAKEKKLSKIFGICLIVTYVISIISGVVMGSMVMKNMFDILADLENEGFYEYDENYRIAVDGVYYDKKGKSYENEADVVLYDEKGRTYVSTTEKVPTEYGYEYEETYYVRDDGEKYYEFDCYVTEDGWFYCDKADLLVYYEPDTENMTDEELDAYYKEQLEQDDDEYRYYDNYMVDKKGNIYYTAYEASWNEKGELITAKNDTTLTK